MKMAIRCKYCGNNVEFEMTDEQYATLVEWESKDRWDREPVQVALQFLSADIREMFIIGMCPKCWDGMFKGDPEEDEEDD